MNRIIRIDPYIIGAIAILFIVGIGLSWLWRERSFAAAECTNAGGVLVRDAYVGYQCVQPVVPARLRIKVMS